MRRIAFSAALVWAIASSPVIVAGGAEPTNEQLLESVVRLEKLTPVLPTRVFMNPQVSRACEPGLPSNHSLVLKSTVHQALIQVYVTPESAAAMKTHSAKFATGTVILKQKFASPTATHAELYTGMFKREPGYSPDCGDWEFFTVSGDGKTLMSRGLIKKCVSCHKHYEKSDFVTKAYMPHLLPDIRKENKQYASPVTPN